MRGLLNIIIGIWADFAKEEWKHYKARRNYRKRRKNL